MSRFDVFGMCNPLYDLHVEATDDLVRELGIEKGGMFLVTHEQQREMVPQIYERIVSASPGGAGANTMIAVAQFGGRAVFTGHAGTDDHSRLYREGMESIGVKANLGCSEGDTGICVVLFTPDAERTMLTYLGKSTSLTPSDVNVEDLRASKYLYATAYLWDTETQKDAVQFAMKEANEHGVKVALSLADPFCVNRHKTDLLNLVQGHVDVLIGNSQEICQLADIEDPLEAAHHLAQWSDLVVTTMDVKGSMITDGKVDHWIPVVPVDAVDTTGAGDAYAAGLLFGLSTGMSVEKSGKIGSYIASLVVGQVGPRLKSFDRQVLIDL